MTDDDEKISATMFSDSDTTPVPTPAKQPTEFTFPDRYRIVSTIGQGGMGSVLEAFDSLLNRACAVKVIKKELLHNESLLQRFRAEAQLTAAINHPNVIQIFDISADPGNPFFVMEKFSSLDLKKLILKEKLPINRLLKIFIQIIKGLNAARKKDLLHRDIKPDNVLIDDEDNIKIIDWGLSKLQKGPQSSELTQTGTVLGSPFYMSPEQCHGRKNLTFKTDIYSAGTTFYYLLTGNPPFTSDSFVEIMMMHCREPRPSAVAKRKDIPAAVSSLIEKMMAVKPDDRPDYEQILQVLETTLDQLVQKKMNLTSVEKLKVDSVKARAKISRQPVPAKKTLAPEVMLDEMEKVPQEKGIKKVIETSPKSWNISLILAIFLGWCGGDRFYLGSWGLGILKAISVLKAKRGAWFFLDIVLLFCGLMEDVNGKVVLREGKEPAKGLPKAKLLLLSILLGLVGMDRFYLGQHRLGITKFLILCFIPGPLRFVWWIVDITLIATGQLKDERLS
ncbi:protein kinase [Candidatus Riflebacteria bacterium]